MTLNPEWFLVVAAAVAVIVLVWLAVAPQGRAPGHRPSSRVAPWCRVVAAVLLLVVALRPGSEDRNHADEAAGADVVVIVDRTTSMGATDFGGRPRMSGVTEDLDSLAASMPSARVTVIVSDNQARIALPASTDSSALRSIAQTMGWRESANAEGSDIGVAEPMARQALLRARQQRPTAKRYVVYMGDGEQTAATAPHSFADLSGLVDGALVLGYGTTSGGTMAVSPGSDRKVMRGGSPAVSHADPQALRTIASQMGGRFVQRGGPEKVTWWENPPAPTASSSVRRDSHWAWWFAAAALACEMVDAWVSLRAWRRIRKEVSS